jgi:hypothetical protein
MSRSAINSKIGDFYNTNYRDNPNGVGMGDTLDFMRKNGINRDDFQMAGNVNNYGPQMSMPQTQTQMPFNPYTNSSGYGGGYMPQMQSPYGNQPSYQQSQPVQPNYGPSQAIIGRSSQVRGTPNIRRYEEGGIASLMDQDE